MELTAGLLHTFFNQKDHDNSHEMRRLQEVFNDTIFNEVFLDHSYNKHTPGLSDFSVSVASLFLKHLSNFESNLLNSNRTPEDLVLKLLSSHSYEVRLEALRIICLCLRGCEGFCEEFSMMEPNQLREVVNSEIIFNLLSEMALLKEVHDECRMKVCCPQLIN